MDSGGKLSASTIIAAAFALMVGLWGGMVLAQRGGAPGPAFFQGGAGPAAGVRAADAPRAVDAPSGMAFLRLRLDTSESQPQACLEFSRELSTDPAVNYRDFLVLEPDAAIRAEASGKLLCLTGLAYDVDRALTIRQGLPDKDGAGTAKDETLNLSFGARPPYVGFAGSGVILPRSEADGLAIETVNVETLSIEVRRVSDRILSRERIEAGRAVAEGSWDFWDFRSAGEDTGSAVFKGELDVAAAGRQNQTVTTVFALAAAIKDFKPGAYVVKVADASPAAGSQGQYNDNPAAAHRWILHTDLALQTFSGADGLDVVARSLNSARPQGGVTLTLIAENNDELARARTDGEGRARFPAPALRGEGGLRPRYVMAYGRGGDFAALDLQRAPVDLSERDVGGRLAPGGVDAFMYTERGIYRPGETVRVSALIRDGQGRAINDRQSVLVITRPNGTEALRLRLQAAQDAGAVIKNVPIDRSAPRGRWRAALFVDGQDAAAGETGFAVEDFVPQRLRVRVQASEAPLSRGDFRPISVNAEFLYGAAGAGLAIEGEARLGVDPNPFPGLVDYRFGRVEERFDERFETLPASLTDGAGQGSLVYAVSPDAPDTTLPLRARVVASVLEPGGRAVRESFAIPVRLYGRYLGIKPSFEGGYLGEGEAADFEVLAVAANGSRVSARGARWQLVREDWSYDWYLEGGEWRWRRTGRDIPVAAGAIDIGPDQPARIAREGLESGSYRLIVEDDSGGAGASLRFGVGWGGDPGDEGAPDIVQVVPPPEPVQPGSRFRVELRPPYPGQAQIVVATDRVVSMRTVNVGPNGATVDLRADADWGAGAYVLVTVMTARDPASLPVPRRAVGVAYVPVDMGKRTLNVAFGEGLEKVTPRQRIEAPIRVEGVPGGERVRMTIAAVDEGILQLTKFQSPDPTGHYFGKRALQVELRDDYGRLLNPNLGAPAIARQGGDGLGGEGLTTVPTKTVALWSGLVTLDRQGRARVLLEIPDFNGELRLMAVAWSESALGAAAKPLTVRDPVVAELTLPRFLAPGDEGVATLIVDNVEGEPGTYEVRVGGEGAAAMPVSPQSFTLARGARQIARLPITASGLGLGKVSLTLDGPGDLRLARSYEIEARTPYLPISRSSVESQAPGTAYRLAPEVFAPFAAGEGRAVVSYSALRGIDASTVLDALWRYPYGCTEQIVSTAMPLLYANVLAQSAGIAADEKLKPRLQEVVNRVLDRQGADGAIGLWRAEDRNASPWLGAYAVDFLRRAKAAGYVVPEQPLAEAYSGLKAVARLNDFASVGYDFSVYSWPGNPDSEALLRSRSAAYALYVLAKARQTDLGALRYFHDARLRQEPSPLARAHIGAALAHLGDRTRARAAFRMAEQALNYRNDGDYYQSPTRDLAGVLALAAEAGETGLVDRLAERLSREAPAPESLSTQEQAQLLAAADALIARTGQLDVTVDGAALAGAVAFSPGRLGDGVSFANRGTGPVFRSIIASGPPASPPPAAQEGFSLTKSVFTLSGARADLSGLRQGERVVVALFGSAISARVHPALAVDLLPAGLEIESVLRPADGASDDVYGQGADGPFAWLGRITEARTAEARDDRFVAAADVGQGGFTFAYVARAVSPGSYTFPAAQVEDMYRPTVFARTGVSRIVIAPSGG